jgi:hypothetical protein
VVYNEEIDTCFTTVVSADHYQNYIPLYCTALRTWYSGKILVFLRGTLTSQVKSALGDDAGIVIHQNSFMEYPDNLSTTNSLRFVDGYSICCHEFTLITDIDLLILQNPWLWHLDNISAAHPFSGYHGAFKKPIRPEICSSWSGDFERVAGGYFCTTPQWYESTRSSRVKYALELINGAAGLYRENDEVILARIIKESGFTVPKSKEYPPELRGLHLGDFKFDHRWKNVNKMYGLFTNTNVKLYRDLINTKKWKTMISTLDSEELNSILYNVNKHLETRR